MYDFNNVIGNLQAVRSLKTALKTGNVSHAYMFCGQKGSGRKLLAYAFAKALECEGKGERPCGECSSCRVFESNNHPDIFYIRPVKKSGEIGIDEIRDGVIKKLETKQYRYKYKVFIIEAEGGMTVKAQNAFLKTLEEPPAYAVFLIISARAEDFLPTVRSRMSVIKTSPVSEPEIKRYLMQEKKLVQEKAGLFAGYAGGSIGSALKLAESEKFWDMHEKITEALCGITHKSDYEVLAAAAVFSKYEDKKAVFDIIEIWYRDILMLRSGGSERIIEKDEKEKLLLSLKDESAKTLAHKMSAVMRAREQAEQNAGFKLVLEVLFIKLKEKSHD